MAKRRDKRYVVAAEHSLIPNRLYIQTGEFFTDTYGLNVSPPTLFTKEEATRIVNRMRRRIRAKKSDWEWVGVLPKNKLHARKKFR